MAVKHKIGDLCKLLQISESGYYRWRKGGSNLRFKQDLHLSALIRRIHKDVKGCYGGPRMVASLKDLGEITSQRRVRRLMKAAGLQIRQKRKFKITTITDPGATVSPNLLNQNFTAHKINQVWVSDITYIRTQQGWLYLGTTIDLCSRAIVGWSVSEKMTKELVVGTLLKAYWTRKPPKGLIHHSDRGSQYTSYDFQNLLSNIGARSSMSAKGNCFDNAVAESAFATIKTETKQNTIFKTKNEAKNVIFEYIEAFYNTVRKHSTLNYCSPNQFEQYLLNSVS